MNTIIKKILGIIGIIIASLISALTALNHVSIYAIKKTPFIITLTVVIASAVFGCCSGYLAGKNFKSALIGAAIPLLSHIIAFLLLIIIFSPPLHF